MSIGSRKQLLDYIHDLDYGRLGVLPDLVRDIRQLFTKESEDTLEDLGNSMRYRTPTDGGFYLQTLLLSR